MLKLIIAFVGCLPELVKLFRHLEIKNRTEADRKKVKKDVQAINKAFEAGDVNLLNDVFKNKLH